MGNNNSSQKQQNPQQLQQQQQQPVFQQQQQQQLLQPQQFQQRNYQQQPQRYQQRQSVKSYNNASIFNDDEEIPQQQQQKQVEIQQDNKPQEFNLQESLSFDLKSMTKAIKLNSKETQNIPAMVAIETKNNEKQMENLNNRANLDLICVIDVSGSMMGNKINQVVEALLYLVELLQENDRIMLVSFASSAQRLLPFKRVSKDNVDLIKNTIKSLHAGGGTNIKSGMNLAMKGLQERKHQNPVSSVFLLSDGQDYSGVVDYLQTDEYIKNTPFTIHSFGFGQDHDPELMNNICNQKDGNFYFVEKLDTVDEMFIDALGGLFCVVAQGIEIKVKLNKDNKVFGDVSISKTYGDLWKYDQNTNEYTIQIQQFISGVSKEYLLELEIPPIMKKLQDFERNAVLLNAEITMYANDDKNKQNPIKKQTELQMTFYNEDEVIPEEAGQINDNVQVNYLRVRGADTIQQCMKQAEQGKYEEGQKMIQKVQDEIKRARPENQQKLKMLVEDLDESKQTCNREQYQQEGRFKMMSNQKAHFEKKSRNRQMKKCLNNEVIFEEQQDMYSNCVQTAFVEQRRAFKKGH